MQGFSSCFLFLRVLCLVPEFTFPRIKRLEDNVERKSFIAVEVCENGTPCHNGSVVRGHAMNRLRLLSVVVKELILQLPG